jgi:hypothetical protein
MTETSALRRRMSPAIEVGGEHLQVTSGTLHLDSKADPSVAAVVEAGMCLGAAEGSSEESSAYASSGGSEHPLASLAAVVCE